MVSRGGLEVGGKGRAVQRRRGTEAGAHTTQAYASINRPVTLQHAPPQGLSESSSNRTSATSSSTIRRITPLFVVSSLTSTLMYISSCSSPRPRAVQFSHVIDIVHDQSLMTDYSTRDYESSIPAACSSCLKDLEQISADLHPSH